MAIVEKYNFRLMFLNSMPLFAKFKESEINKM